MWHNFIDKKTPKPQPDSTLTDHPVRTELPKSAGQWRYRHQPTQAKVVRVPCKKETGTRERGAGSPSTRTPLMSGSGTIEFIATIFHIQDTLCSALVLVSCTALTKHFIFPNSIVSILNAKPSEPVRSSSPSSLLNSRKNCRGETCSDHTNSTEKWFIAGDGAYSKHLL